jgi:hypothetical protein
MKLNFLKLPSEDRKIYIEEAAGRRGLSPVILEKDFWVCWLLHVLFDATFHDAIVFKGGTSLSKVFGVIDRLSEDIDLSLAPDFLGIGEPELDASFSKGQASKWMKKAEAECINAVRDRLTPELEETVSDLLGKGQEPWLEFAVDPSSHSPVVFFRYPTSQPAGFEYLKRSVKLEFGSLSEQRPTERHSIRPWIADVLPDAFTDWQCSVVALDVQRTFWEKATILHTEYHRPADKATPDRYSRHYADTAALALHAAASLAITQNDLRQRVVDWKSRFFSSRWARYDLAQPPTFNLVPPAEREQAFRRDYEAMRDMYLSEPVSFDQILATLATVERQINGLAHATGESAGPNGLHRPAKA